MPKLEPGRTCAGNQKDENHGHDEKRDRGGGIEMMEEKKPRDRGVPPRVASIAGQGGNAWTVRDQSVPLFIKVVEGRKSPPGNGSQFCFVSFPLLLFPALR